MFRLICFAFLVAKGLGAVVEDPATAIINGNLASIEDYPYYAFLGTEDGLHCGGAFIARDLVLTAAHCLNGGGEFKVYTGVTTMDDVTSGEGYEVKTIEYHPDYVDQSHLDIGLVKLKEEITLSDSVQLIKPATENPPTGGDATVVGFGVHYCDNIFCRSPSSQHLRSAAIKITEYDEDGVMHTEGDNQNTCYGDSGGPIVYDGKVVGLVSSGQFIDCSGYDTQAPVAPHIQWIEDTAKTMNITAQQYKRTARESGEMDAMGSGIRYSAVFEGGRLYFVLLIFVYHFQFYC